MFDFDISLFMLSMCNTIITYFIMVDIQITKWKYRRNQNEDISNGMITSIDSVTKCAYMLQYKYAGNRERKMQMSRDDRRMNRLCVHQ